jgi:hypothetical protein
LMPKRSPPYIISDPQKRPESDNEFITITSNLKNAADVRDGINVIVQKPIEI